MENKFLERIADFILGIEKQDLIKTLVIFPNKRSEIFLRNHLKLKTKENLWLPDFYSIDEFMINTSGLIEMDPTNIFFELYDIHKNIAGDEARMLDDFLSWAPTILNDFNDIDLHLADPQKVFTHLSEARAMEVWNLNGAELTELQSNYLRFYQSLYDYYLQLNDVLLAKNSGYKGLIYRHLVENIEKKIKKTQWERFVLVGFNALSEAEIRVFGHLIKNYHVDVFWDVDSFYFKGKPNQQHEAGRFIHELIRRWDLNEVNWLSNQLLTDKKKIKILGVSKSIGQTKFAAQQITDWVVNKEDPEQSSGNNKHKLLDTAIVLADENMLIPMLNSLPDIEDNFGNKVGFNITMGYPMSNTSISHFVNSWLELLIAANENHKGLFPVPHLLGILNNPVLKLLLENLDSETSTGLVDKILTNNSAYLSHDQLTGFLNNGDEECKKLLKTLLSPATNPLLFIDALVAFLELVKMNIGLEKSKYVLLREQLINMFALSKKLATYFYKFKKELTYKTILKIFNQLVRRSEISLKGEPLNGIQIMGMLETRNLDFKNVILLSANEGVLPKSNNIESFIPFDIRRNYGFPLPADKTDVYAYHFFRLMQRAENITLVFNSESENFGGGEISRFILQIQNELKSKNPKIEIEDGIVKIPLTSTFDEKGISITKDEEVMNKLYERLEKGLSPTALSSYIKCKLQFYFTYILKIKPGETLSDSIEANVFGTVVHNVLEKIYENFKGGRIDPQELAKYTKRSDKMVIEEFHSEFSGGNITSGKNLLIVEVAKKYVKQFLNWEIKSLKRETRILVSTEEEKHVYIKIGERKVRLRGRVDRVDETQNSNILRIVDYKTGSVKPNDLKLKDWEGLTTKSEYEKAFQVMFYTYLYNITEASQKEYESGIISMRNLSNGFIPLVLPEKLPLKEGLHFFEEELKNLLGELLSEDSSFDQTVEEKNCTWCDYKNICNRKEKSFF